MTPTTAAPTTPADSTPTHSNTLVLLVCGVAALVSALLAAAFLPGVPAGRRSDDAAAPVVAASQEDARQ